VTAVAAYSLAPIPAGLDLATPTPAAPADRSWSSRRVIIDRNLFGAVLVDATPPPVEEDLEPTELPLGLLGTLSASDPTVARAAVWNAETGDYQVVRVGDPVPGGGARVIRIERTRVLLRHEGQTRELVMDPDGEYRPPDRRPTRRQIWAAQRAKRKARRRSVRR
jgi:hypothetical protein